MAILSDNILIHIGMPKCASTMLQKGFWGNLEGIDFASHEYNTFNELHETVLDISRCTQDQYNHDNIFQKYLDFTDKSKPLVISSELFVWNGIQPDVHSYADKIIIAERLKKLFPEAKILIVIRNQIDMLKSLYSQLYAMVDFSLVNLSFDKWIDTNLREAQVNRNSVFSVLNYYKIIKTYKSLFSDVKVILYEELIKDKELHISKIICPLMGIDASVAIHAFNDKKFNSRHHKSEMILLRASKASIEFLQKYMGYPQRIIPKKTREKFMKSMRKRIRKTKLGKVKTDFKSDQEEAVRTLLKDGNNALLKEFNLNISEYNYPL